MKIHWPRGICVPLLLLFATAADAQPDQKPATPVTISLMTSDTQVASNGSYSQTLHLEMRASNDAAAAQVGQARVPYDASAMEIAIVDAHTHKADGKNIPVEAAAIYDQAPSGQQTILVDNQRSKLIVFPQFAAGDTAVYTIRITVQNPNFENQFFKSEFFLRALAYDEVRETVTAPKSFPLFVENHDIAFNKKEDGANIVYSWHYSAPQPETEEAVTQSPLEHTPRFFVSSFKDYAQLGQAYARMSEPKRLVTPKISALADQITAGTNDAKGQAQKLYEWVSTHIRYIGIELGTGSFIPHDVDTIIANGYGDCKDHDLLLQVLLKAKGIESQSVLLNGGDTYFVTEVPTLTTIDHVITFVPQINLYLDSTAQVAPFGILPMQEYGKPMVIASMTAAHSGTMPLLPPGLAKITYKMAAALDKDGWLSGTSTTTASGPYAITLRTIGLAIQAAGPGAANSFLTASGYRDASGNFNQASPIGFEPDFTISGNFKASGWSDEAAGKNSFFIPGGMRLFGLSGNGIMGPFDPGKLKPGEPTLCFSASATEDLSLKAPAGTSFEKVPADIKIETANLRYLAHWSLTGDTMSVHREFVSNIDQQFCSGSVRSETAAALKKISDSYDTNISLTREASAEEKTVTALYSSMEAHANARQFDLAAADYTKIIALTPNDGRAYRGRGLALARAHQFDLANADMAKGVALEPENPAAYFDRGRVHLIGNQPLLALPDLDKAIAMKPDYFEAISVRGAAHLFAKQFALAIADFNKALMLKPGDSETLDGRAQAHYEAHEYELAIADYDALIIQMPGNSSAFLHRGDAKIKLGRKADGERDIAAATKLDPSLK